MRKTKCYLKKGREGDNSTQFKFTPHKRNTVQNTHLGRDNLKSFARNNNTV